MIVRQVLTVTETRVCFGHTPIASSPQLAMRKRGKAGANDAVASSSGSEAAEEELFAAEERLGGVQPAAEPAWSDDDDAASENDEEDSEASGSDLEEGSASDADSEASSAAEDSPSDDDELDTAIVELAAGRDGGEPEPNSLSNLYVQLLLSCCTRICICKLCSAVSLPWHEV